MSKYRLRFIKGFGVKYVPHLDLLRLYQRAVRRANLPIAYSQGFNPHQQMSFAQPLSVGFTGISEYFDIETVGEVNTEEFMNALNNCLPEGTEVTYMRAIESGEKNAMASVAAGSYKITLDRTVDREQLQTLLNSFLAQEEIMINKETKKGKRDVDIRNDVYELKALEEHDGKSVIYAFISTGSERNLKPDLLIEAIYKFANWEYFKFKISYERQELFKLKDEVLVSLNEQ